MITRMRSQVLSRFWSHIVCVCIIIATNTASADIHINLLIKGRAQPYLVSTNGVIGVNPSSRLIVNNLPGSLIALNAGLSNILLKDPYSDTYALTLHGSFDDKTLISITYYDDVTGKREEHTGTVWYHGDQINTSFDYNPALDPVIQLNTPVEGPTDVSIVDVEGNAQLNWSAVIDPRVTDYRIYGRLEAYPQFQLLGQTQSLSFDTGHAVRHDDSGEHWQYIVLGVNAVGDESFYTDTASNLLTLTALFAADKTEGEAPFTVDFSDASLGTVNAWEWDFDGDSVIDSTNPNPSHTYTQAGSYNVSLTVIGPLGTSTKTQLGYITAFVDSDGDGLSDSYEAAIGLNVNLVDTDGDGLVDGLDGLVPVSSYPGGIDLDFDGFVDGELDLGTSSDTADTDGDGVNDGEELTDGTNPLSAISFAAIPNGDINNDGQVDTTDLLIAMRILTNQYTPTVVEQARWDVAPLVAGIPQSDGQNNVGDYVVLLRKVIGAITY